MEINGGWNMKRFTNVAAQGELGFIRVEKMHNIKHSWKSSSRLGGDGRLIIGHSETGHHHWMDGSLAELFMTADSLEDMLVVKEPGTALKHDRADHQHEDTWFDPGTYRVRRLREYEPGGFRASQD
jgi:hypothetical protein